MFFITYNKTIIAVVICPGDVVCSIRRAPQNFVTGF
jgi:hypothetical protein